MEPNIESLDWTRRLLGERETEQFTNIVVWPAIDNLFRRDCGRKYLSYQNVGDEFDLTKQFGTPSGEQLMIVSMEADCNLCANKADTMGFVTFAIEERLTDDEDYLTSENCDLQIWKRTTFYFNTVSANSVYVDCCPYLMDSKHDEIEDLRDEEKSLLAFLVESRQENLIWQDCLDVMNILFVLGVPENVLNESMRRYEKKR